MSIATIADPKSAREFEDFEPFPEPEPGLPRGFEFVDGQLVEQNVSALSSYVAGECFFHLRSFVRPRGLGWVFPEGTSYRIFADDETRVRRADASFHRLNRLTAERVLAEGYTSVVPDLVVEVISPNDLADAVNHKLLEWLRAGVALVWVIHPHDRTLHAYRSDGFRLFTETDTLTAEPVLPEFQLPLTELFRMPVAN